MKLIGAILEYKDYNGYLHEKEIIINLDKVSIIQKVDGGILVSFSVKEDDDIKIKKFIEDDDENPMIPDWF